MVLFLFFFALCSFSSPAAGQVSLSIVHPVDASALNTEKEQWHGALAEDLLFFRLGALDIVTFPCPAVSGSDLESILDSSRARGADYILQTGYEITESSTAHWYLELIPTDSKSDAHTHEVTFGVDELPTGVVEWTRWIAQQTGIEQDERLSRFFELPSFVYSPREARLLGDLAFRRRSKSARDALLLIPEYNARADRDGRNLLVQFVLARMHSEAGLYEKAATFYKDLLAVMPNYAGFYKEICRCYRLSARYAEALRFAASAEGKGLASESLLIEGGLSLEALGRWNKAHRTFGKVLEFNPHSLPALLFFARRSNVQDRHKEALEHAGKALKRHDYSHEAWLEKGRALLALDRIDEAREALESAAIRNSEDPEIDYVKALLYEKRGEYGTAAQYHERVLSADPNDFASHMNVAAAYNRAGNEKKAVEALVRAERFFSDSTLLQREIGLLAWEMGDSVTARRHLERFVDIRADDVDALVVLGNIYLGAGELDKAFGAFNHAMAATRDKNECRIGLARLYLQKGTPDGALPLLKKVLEENAGLVSARRMLGDCWWELRLFDRALPCYETVRSEGVIDEQLQERIADLHFKMSPANTSAAEYKRLLDLNPASFSALYRLAILDLRRGNVDDAEGRIEEAGKLGRASPGDLLALGIEFEKNNKPRRSIAMYEDCIQQKPFDVDALLRLALVHEQLGNRARAAGAYMSLFDIAGDKQKESLAKAGFLYEEAGLPEEARGAFALFVEHGYANPDVRSRLAALEYERDLYGAVITLLRSVGEEALTNPRHFYILGDSYYKTAQFRLAVAPLERAIDLGFDQADLMEKLAVAYEKSSDIEKALAVYQELTSTGSSDKHSDWAHKIAEIHELMGNQGPAVEQYHENIRQFPDEIRNYERLSSLYLRRGEPGNARDVLESFSYFASYPDSLRRRLAEICRDTDDIDAAIGYFQAFLKDNPEDRNGWCDVARMEFTRRKYTEASVAARKAIDLQPDDYELQILLGKSLIRDNKSAEAMPILETAAALDSTIVEPLTYLVAGYREAGQSDRLVDALHRMTSFHPDSQALFVELGEAQLSLGRVPQAIAALERAIEINPDDAAVRLCLADSYGTRGEKNKQYDHLTAALRHTPDNAEVHYALGSMYADEHSLDKGEIHLGRAIELTPDHGPSLYRYAALLHETGNRLEQALETAQRAVAVDGFNSKYLVLCALLTYQSGESDSALRLVERALTVDSVNIEALALAGLIYLVKGEYEKAEVRLNQAITLDRTCAICFRHLGDLFFDQSRYDRAAAYYNRTIEIGGYDTHALLKVGRCHMRTGNDTEARAALSRILESEPAHDEALYRLCHSHVRTGEVDLAREFLKRMDGGESTVWRHLAKAAIQEAEGKIDDAMISYHVALNLRPDTPEAFAGCGRVGLVKKEFDAAVVYFGKALASDPYNPHLLLDMGRAYEGIGDPDAANEIYAEVSDKYPLVAETYCLIAQLRSRENAHKSAIEIIREGLSHNALSPRLHMALAHEYVLTGKYHEAIAAYGEAVRRGGRHYREAYLHISNIYDEHLDDKVSAKKYFKKYLRLGGTESSARGQVAELH